MFTSSSSVAGSRRDFLKLGAMSAGVAFLPRALWANYEATATEQGNDVVLRCCVMSDVHFNGKADSKETKRFKRSLEFMYDYSAAQPYKNFDALVVVGDMSNHGTENEIGLFKKAMDEGIRPGTDTFLCMGNHEFYGGNPQLWQSIFGVEPNRHYDRNGYRFIAISPEKGTMSNGDYLYKVDWLKKELDEARALDPDKPIFVFQHYPISPTVYGGRGYDDWGAEDLYDTLQAYPTVINFSGHTHYPINNPRCAWQGCFTAFGTGSLSYLCHGHEGNRFTEAQANDSLYGQFYVMEVRRDNSVVLKPYDLTTESFFDVVYYVAKPGAVDEYAYTDKRYFESERPVWRDGSKVSCDVSEGIISLSFPQAYSKDVVSGYRVELERLDEKTNNWTPAEIAYIWSRYHERNMPEFAKGNLESFKSNSSYRGKVIAYNAFMLESESALEFEFKTAKNPNEPEDKDAPAPKANFYSLAVVGGALVNQPSADWTKDRPWKKYGAPKVVNDKALGDAILFSGKECYKSANTLEDYKRLQRISVGARFSVAKGGSGDTCVISNTQVGGIGLGYNYSEQVVRVWAYINGSMSSLDAKVAPETPVVAYVTYDGNALILYIDGKEVARKEKRGKLTFTGNSTARSFAFGADVAVNDGAECYFKGKIAFAKVYTWALTAEQVANLSK